MRKIVSLFLAALSCCSGNPCFADSFLYIKHKAAASTCADPSGYVTWERFEGANADNNSVSGYNQTGWLGAGTYSIVTSPNLETTTGCGTHSIQLDGSGGATASIRRSIGAADNANFYFLYRPQARPGSNYDFATVINSGGSTLAKVQIRSTGALTLFCGTASGNTTGVMSANTTYHVWLGYTKGTGTNAVCYTAFNQVDNTAKPSGSDANYKQLTNGTGTTQTDKLILQSFANSTIHWFDHLLVSSPADIGANP